MVEWIKSKNHFDELIEKHKEFLVMFFYADFSSPAKRALSELEEFGKENKDVPIVAIDVVKVKGIHKNFKVSNVPTFLTIKKGKVFWRVEGVESAQLYDRLLSDMPSRRGKKGGKSHRVVVYSGAGCPACGTAKAYLRSRGVNFREIDVSRDRHAAERLMQRSGQMAVPQIDIDGHLIVGFDKTRIDRLITQ